MSASASPTRCSTTLGLARQGFLGDPDQALFVIVLIGIWGGIGFPLVIYLAALQDVPRELVDAAAVDGARRWAMLRHVILPQLLPVTIFLVVWQTLLSLQLFDLVYATTRGGPLDSTAVIVYYIYNQASQLFNAGYAAAVAYVVALFLILLVGAQLLLQPPPGEARVTAGRSRRCPTPSERGWRLRSARHLSRTVAIVRAAADLDGPELVHVERPDQPVPADDHPRLAAPRRLEHGPRRLRLPALVPQLDDRRAR